jgi:hypothetical protein
VERGLWYEEKAARRREREQSLQMWARWFCLINGQRKGERERAERGHVEKKIGGSGRAARRVGGGQRARQAQKKKTEKQRKLLERETSR